MKQFLAISLALLYCLLSVGAGMQLHLCNDSSETSFVYQLNEGDSCVSTMSDDHACCAKEASKSSSSNDHSDKDCCEDIQLILANELKGVTLTIPSLEENTSFPLVWTSTYPSYDETTIDTSDEVILSSEKFPREPDNPRWITHCSLVLYA